MIIHRDILIRDYKIADKPAVLNLLRLNIPEFFASEEEFDFENYLENELEYYYVLASENTVVGCGGFNFSGDYTNGKISWDILHPEYQGKSLGTKLLIFRIHKLKEFKTLEKITVRTSQLVYRFYEKSGFKLLEIIKITGHQVSICIKWSMKDLQRTTIPKYLTLHPFKSFPKTVFWKWCENINRFFFYRMLKL